MIPSKKMWRKVTKGLALMVLMVFALSVVGCGGTQEKNQTGEKAGKKQLVMADLSWDSIKVHNRIAGFIIEKGYGYPQPKYVFGETMPIFQGLARGDIDILMEVWKDNHMEAWQELIAGGTVKELGRNLNDAPQGWYVPTYMIKGDAERGIKATAPDLKSVQDLPKYWQLFKDPQVPNKGRLYGGPPGWLVTELMETKFKTYGLDKTFNLFSPGSDTSLAASMVAAYDKGQPWVGYYWEPTWVMGKLDMTILEEPPYDPAKWEDINHRGCAFPPAQVMVAINTDLESEAPEIVEFLRKYETTLEQNNDFLSFMNENNDDMEAAVIYFLKKYPDSWRAWVPAEVAERVEQALKEVK